MKQALGWHWPDHEKHLLDWMHTAPVTRINGRQAYQGKKQLAVLTHVTNFDTAIDVGAHIGLWSYNLAYRFERVEAFEPVAAHRECFKANVEAKNVNLHDCALGADNGSVSIASDPTSSGDSRVHGPGDIPLRRLDMFSLRNVGLIKVDCEGFEENVLIGGLETIKACRPVIIVEQKRDMALRFGLEPQGAVSFLKKLGYKQAAELSGDYIMVP